MKVVLIITTLTAFSNQAGVSQVVIETPSWEVCQTLKQDYDEIAKVDEVLSQLRTSALCFHKE